MSDAEKRIREIEYIIKRYEQLKKVTEGYKACVEAVVGGDIIFRDEEGGNVYYGITKRIEDIINFIDMEISWLKERISKLKGEATG
jgi:hypothetical protein